AHRLLARRRLSEVTTREVAEQAQLAHGTLFNYFATKEDLALALCRQLLEQAEADYAGQRRGDEALDEDLFAHAAAGLRRPGPYPRLGRRAARRGLPSRRRFARGRLLRSRRAAGAPPEVRARDPRAPPRRGRRQPAGAAPLLDAVARRARLVGRGRQRAPAG